MSKTKMTKINKQPETYLFNKKHKVSVWASQNPYAEIPEEYFEETFSKGGSRAKNTWSDNFKIRYFKPEDMETNGSQDGVVDIKQAVGECSFSTSFIDNLMSKAKKKNMLEVTWVVVLFEYEYSAKTSGVESDDYLTLLGAFNYDDDADSVYEIEFGDEDELEKGQLEEGQFKEGNELEENDLQSQEPEKE